MRATIVALTLLAAFPALARAAAPGMNLTWANCSSLASSANYSFACDDNTTTRKLICSFRLASDLPDFVGVSVTIDYELGGSDTPDYFQFGTGGCRYGEFLPIKVGAISGCTNPYSGANQAGGFVIEPWIGPNRWRIRADWFRDAIGAVTANTLYTAYVMSLSTNGAFDEGLGYYCPGCCVGAEFVLRRLEVYGLSNGLAAALTNADFRNRVTYQGGPSPGGCPTPARGSSWGAVKALYR